MEKINVSSLLNTTYLDENCGIRENEAFASFLPDSTLKKIQLFAITVFRELKYSLQAFSKNVLFSPFFSSKYKKISTANTDKQALVVFFHGLNGKPSVWNRHIAHFRQVSKDFPSLGVELYSPPVPKKGHCTFEDPELLSVYENIATWIDNNPEKPVIFFGQSDGARKAVDAEVWLRQRAPTTPVHVSLTGGVLYGTSKIDSLVRKIPPKWLKRLTFGLLTPVACQELSLGSASSKSLLSRARLPLEECVAQRDYRKYAALIDSHVLQKGSSLPILNPGGKQKGKRERDYLVPGYGHNSLVHALIKEQVEKSLHWMQKQQGISHPKTQLSTQKSIHWHKNRETGRVTIRDHRNRSQRMAMVIKALRNHSKTALIRGIRRVSRNKRLTNQEFPWTAATNSSGLYLMVHGLRGSPSDWKNYVEAIQAKDPYAHIWVPPVSQKGNCALQTATEPLLNVVKDYLQKFPGRPCTLIGTSNGSRIVQAIESFLEPEILGRSRLSVVSIAGVHYGTKLVDRLKRLHLLPLLRLHPALQKEFPFGSQFAQESLALWQQRQVVWKKRQQPVAHLFCASTEDEQVRDLESSLPYHPDSMSQYALFQGQSHISLVDASRSKVLHWLSEHEKEQPSKSCKKGQKKSPFI